jgi:hypothetical protein
VIVRKGSNVQFAKLFLRLAHSRKPLGERRADGFGLAGTMFLDLLLYKIERTLEAALPDNVTFDKFCR